MKHFRKPQQNRPKKSSLIIGREALKDALQSGKQLERIYLENTAHGADILEIRRLALEHSVPVNKVPLDKLKGFNIENHEGCVGVISKIQYLCKKLRR